MADGGRTKATRSTYASLDTDERALVKKAAEMPMEGARGAALARVRRNALGDIEKERLDYLADPDLGNELAKVPHLWWYAKRQRYPRMWEFVRSALCASATSVRSEVTWSHAG